MPDEALFTAAKSGSLDKPEQVAVQAARMLKDDRARTGIRDFHMQWLGLYGVDGIDQGRHLHEVLRPRWRSAMMGETGAFLDATLFGPQATGKLEAMLTSSTTYVNALLATHYGVKGVTGDAFTKVDMNPMQRAGILTQGAFLAKHSKEVRLLPRSRRGVYVLRNVLCQEIPEPNILLPPPPEQMQGVTTRKLYEDFTKAAACQACHRTHQRRRLRLRELRRRRWLPRQRRGPGGRLQRLDRSAVGHGRVQERHRVRQGDRQDARGERVPGPQLDAGPAAPGGAARRGRLAQGHPESFEASSFDMRELSSR